MRAPLFREVPGTPERPSGHRRDGGESSRNSSWLGGRATRNTAAVSVVLLLLLAAVGQFGTEREWNAGLREMVRARVESAGVASAVRRVQTLEEISDGMAHRGEGGMRSVAGGERTGRESAPPPPRVFDIKLRGDETEETEQEKVKEVTYRGEDESDSVEEPNAETATATPPTSPPPPPEPTATPPPHGKPIEAAVDGDQRSSDNPNATFTRLRRRDERLRVQCEPCFGAAFKEHAKVYTTRSKVLVLEGRWGNGLGNNMDRWRSLFSLAESTGWAVYVDAGGCGAGTGRGTGDDNVTCAFDPGYYFTGDGFDWRWHPEREREFNESIGPVTPMRSFHHRCRAGYENADRRPCQITEHGWPSDADSATIQQNAVAHNGYTEDPGGEDGKEASQNDKWLHEWLNSATVLGWRYVKLRLRTPYDLHREADENVRRDYGTCVVDGNTLDDHESWDLSNRCRAQHFLRPTPALLEGLSPVLSQMDKWAGVAAIHIRTGFADWQEYWLTQAKPTDQSEITKMEGKYACDPVTIVKNVGVVFKQCNGRYDERVCTNWWTLPTGVKKDDADPPRGPSSDDALVRCGDLPPAERGSGDDEDGEDGGAVAAAAICAARLAQAAGEDSSAGGWGVYVLGDSPAVIKALARYPSLRGHVAYQRDEDVVGVTFRSAQCDGDGCVDAGRDSTTRHSNTTPHEGDSRKDSPADSPDSDGGNRAWMRAVVDMYVASLADADVQLPGSSFMNAGANRLSVTNDRRNSLGFGGEVVMDQAVTPIGETEERSAGFQKNYENYVLLSASHCEFDDE
jgi:hypothetical protein